ncbi:glycosyltransferase [Reyranella sp.]|uniref:glycosyltransferase n=1 Tax=Reyranella sp. TaxID=1929291 RepID=UPI003BAA4AEC
MPTAPPVGVVIANHNNGAFVERTMESAARQSVRDLTVVVVDDASTDDSDEAIRRCLARLDDPRFRYLPLETNLGQAGALLRGMAGLDTPFVCFLDSDDVWYEDFVARHLAVHLNADFPVAMTYCDSHIIDANGRLLAGTAWWFDSSDPGAWNRRTVDPARLPTVDPSSGTITYPSRGGATFHPQWSLAGATNTTASMMLRRSFVDLVMAPPTQDLRLYVDYYLSTFAGLMTGAIAIDQPLYGYRMHGRNGHSDATVPGGAYNSSSRPWAPIRDYVLQMVQLVLRTESTALCRTFGEERHAEAEALIAAAIGDLPAPADKPRWRPELLLARAADLLGGGLPRRRLRGRS